jgi:hypothetical protein
MDPRYEDLAKGYNPVMSIIMLRNYFISYNTNFKLF